MHENKTVVLITGGTGFAGSHLAQLLAKQPDQYELHLTHVSPVPPELTAFLPSAQFHQVELTDTTAVHALVDSLKPDQVYQLASIPVSGSSFTRATEIMQVNTAVIHNMLEAVKTVVPDSRMLVVTSAEVYGSSTDQELPIREDHPFRPVNPYGVSKVTQDVLADCYARAFDLGLVRVRPFNHIGERQQSGFAIADFARQIVDIERGRATTLKVGNLTTLRDYTDVTDIVRGYKLLMEQGIVGEAYNIGSGNLVSMQSMLDQLCALSTTKITIEQDSSLFRPVDVPIMQADISKVRALGWQPEIPLSETLERILGYWRQL